MSPPPPPPSRRYPEVVRVTEDDSPPTQPERGGRRSAPEEPFPLQPSHAQLMRELQLSTAIATEVLATQRKLARQGDGLLQATNARFDIFHRELALLRGGQELEAEIIEEPRRGRRLLVIAGKVGEYMALAIMGALLLRALARLAPVLEQVLTSVGL
jgi:hypothetical protein